MSTCKKMSDEDLQRAASVYGAELQKKANERGKKYAYDHKEDIAKAAYDNREVIANVGESAYMGDRGDSVVNAAYQDGKDHQTSNYIRGQNNKPN